MERFLGGLLPTDIVRAGFGASLQWAPFKSQHLSTVTAHLLQLFPAKLWWFRYSLVTALGKTLTFKWQPV